MAHRASTAGSSSTPSTTSSSKPCPKPRPTQARCACVPRSSASAVRILHAACGEHPFIDLPYRPGHEVVGVVDAVGAGVDDVMARHPRRGGTQPGLWALPPMRLGSLQHLSPTSGARVSDAGRSRRQLHRGRRPVGGIESGTRRRPRHPDRAARHPRARRPPRRRCGRRPPGPTGRRARRRSDRALRAAGCPQCRRQRGGGRPGGLQARTRRTSRRSRHFRSRRRPMRWHPPSHCSVVPPRWSSTVSPSASSVAQAVDLVDKGGAIMVVGVAAGATPVRLDLIQDRELALSATSCTSGKTSRRRSICWHPAPSRSTRLITTRFDFEHAAEAFAASADPESVKVVVTVNTHTGAPGLAGASSTGSRS